MEVLKVNKFGRTYRTGTQAAQALVVRNYFFNLYANVQLVKHERDIITAEHIPKFTISLGTIF